MHKEYLVCICGNKCKINGARDKRYHRTRIKYTVSCGGCRIKVRQWNSIGDLIEKWNQAMREAIASFPEETRELLNQYYRPEGE